MARKKKVEAEKENSERWLLTYSDLITLLMIFFIIMYSLSQVDAKKFQQMAQSLSQVLGGASPTILETPGPSVIEGQAGVAKPDPPGQGSGNTAASAAAAAAEQAQLEAIKEEIKQVLKDQGKLDKNISVNVVVTEQERGIVISLKDTLLFYRGSDQLTPRARDLIYQLGDTLKTIPNYIRVEGHTDTLPIHTEKFPSNWELSVLRATTVAHLLINENKIAPDRISAAGYGEYRPLVPNVSEDNRAMNRRVDIVLLKSKYDYFEPPVAGKQ